MSKRLADIVFVLDLTVSMHKFIKSFANTITNIINNLKREGIDWQIGIVGYGDLKLKDPMQILPLTTNMLKIKEFLESLPAYEGGDIPESTLDAIKESLKLFNVNGSDLRNFKAIREQADRIVFVVTDSPPHLPDEEGFWEDFTIDLLKWTRTACFIAGPDIDVYRKITSETGGKLFPIKEEEWEIEELLNVIDGLPQTVGTITFPWFGSKQIENPFEKRGLVKEKVDTITATEGLDVILIFDTSGSMGEVLSNVKNQAAKFLEKLSSKTDNWRFGIVEFYNWNGIKMKEYPITNDVEEALKNISKLRLKIKSVFWGEKGSEKILEKAIKMTEPNRKKVFILITDGPDLERPDERDEMIDEMLKMLKENSITFFAVAPNVARYHKLCEETGGKFFDLYKSRGRADLEAIAEAIKA